ncbi:hypothetical protein DSM3645_09737 [Blastopirellula marina DSM 3645]|uniref:Uncharacterized protein n=1 Tax=Blastopirellula marina DSM 3645 TaxID=314230 RepID=A3ZLN8_9BACT|nr:hypothetical protein DSM3645_09737 [Blastopirellula marina DSM 3645]
MRWGKYKPTARQVIVLVAVGVIWKVGALVILLLAST